MKYLIFFGCCCQLFTICYSQEWKDIKYEEVTDIYTKMHNAYEGENYIVEFERSTFLNPGDSAYVQETGTIYRGKDSQYAMYSNTGAMIQQADVKVTVVNDVSSVYLSEKDSVFELLGALKPQTNSADFLFAKAYQKGDLMLQVFAKNEGTIRQCVMQIGPDYQMKKMTIYFSSGNYQMSSVSDESIENPVVEVTYTPIRKLEPADRRKLSAIEFVYPENGSYRLTNTLLAKEFKLTDLRNNKTTSTTEK